MPHLARFSKKQAGFSMFITLLVLVLMMLAAVALTRSVDTAGLIMGNIAFKQSAVLEAECGVENAIKTISASTKPLPNKVDLNKNLINKDYIHYIDWVEVTECSRVGYKISYVIHEIYQNDFMKPGSSYKAGQVCLDCFFHTTDYRITVRVEGPQNTVSYVQVVIRV